MSKPLTKKNEARKRLVKKLVDGFKFKYPQRYKNTVDVVKDKRGKLKDGEYATVDGEVKLETMDMREVVVLPDKLNEWMDVALENPRFLEENDELRWFVKEYPEFKVPKKL